MSGRHLAVASAIDLGRSAVEFTHSFSDLYVACGCHVGPVHQIRSPCSCLTHSTHAHSALAVAAQASKNSTAIAEARCNRIIAYGRSLGSLLETQRDVRARIAPK